MTIVLLDREQKAALVEKAIEAVQEGSIIDVTDASYSACSVCIGDFREIGWSKKITTRDSMCWQWLGPTPIKVAGIFLAYGYCTPEVEMDWT